MLRLPLRTVPALDRAHVLAALRATERSSGVVVLAHHRIGEPVATPGDPALFSATVEQLDEQLRTVAAVAQIITPDEFEEARHSRGRHVLLSFDDGYRDARTAALPVLRAHGVRAVFFVATGLIDRPRLPWWDELTWIARRWGRPMRAAGWIEHYKRLPDDAAERYVDALAEQTGVGRPPAAVATGEWCSWDDIRALHAAGMELGAHTHDHPVLARAPATRQHDQIERSLDRLAAETGRRPRWFAYPVGQRDSFDGMTRLALAQLGLERAFTAYGGWNTGGADDRYDVRRITASSDPRRIRAQVGSPALFVAAPRLPVASSR